MGLALRLAVNAPFDRAMEHCDNLISVHTLAGTGGPGRRRAETSVNRAVVVIAIASWQAVVQDMAKYLLDQSMPQPTDPNFGVARLVKGQVDRAMNQFSTPNAQNSRELLKLVGFDPRPYWTWTNGNRSSARTRGPVEVEAELASWLKLRHAIAHGDETLPEVDVLQAVRQGTVSLANGPTVRLDDAKRCTAFIRKLAAVSIAGLDAENP